GDQIRPAVKLKYPSKGAWNPGEKFAPLSWRLLKDQVGIYFENRGLDLMDNVFKATTNTDTGEGGTVADVWLSACIISDARVQASARDTKIDTADIPDITRMVEYGKDFKYMKPISWDVEIPGIGEHTTASTTKLPVTSINDASGLSMRCKDEFYRYNTSIDAGQIMIPWIDDTYWIGDVIGSIHDKHMVINSAIVGVTYDFNAQTTTLYLSDERYR
ncbi:hypothetical protein, partial [Candidatus Magnetobacterium casense]